MTATTKSPTASKLPRWMWLLAVISVLALIWGMWRALDTRNEKKVALEASISRPATTLSIPPNEWLTAAVMPLQLGIAITGSLSAVETATIKARVPGELRDLQVREGDSVAAGQVIAKVDATESEARFRQAKLQADASQAQVAIAQRQFDNNRALVDKGFISSTALATSSANLQAAQANYAAARAGQDAARKSLDDTVLRSPIAGQVARRMAQSGERVNVEAPIIEVVNLSTLELQAQLPANDSAQVRVGQAAQLQLRASQGQVPQTLHAEVVRINPSASIDNRAVPVYLRLDSSPQVQLRPGMYVEGFIQTGKVQTLAVPLGAVRTDQPLPYVQAVSDGVVQHMPVKLGVQSLGDAQTWVAVEGLLAGQQLLSGQVGGVPAGTRVLLTPAAVAVQPPASPASNPQ